MVGPGPPAHDTGAAGLVLARDAMGNAARSPAAPSARVCPLIPEACAHLQRCPGPRPPPTLDLADFPRLPRELRPSPAFAASPAYRDVPKLSAAVPSRLLLIACRPPRPAKPSLGP